MGVEEAGEANAAGGHPICFAVHPIPHDSYRPLGLLSSGGDQAHLGVIKHRNDLRYRSGFEAGLDGAGLDAADKMEALFLPEVEVTVALVDAVHDPGLARRQELGDQGAFIAFAIGQTDFSEGCPD